MLIETKPQIVNASQDALFSFLMDMNNFKELFPEEKISEWESNNETCSMKVKNMGFLGLKRTNTTPKSIIFLNSFGKVPFQFTLNFFLSEKDNNHTELHLSFDGKVNPFMKMMVEKPLNNFFEELISKLVKSF